MIFPDSAKDLEIRVRDIIDACNDTRFERAELYKRRESYYIFGSATRQPVKHNRIHAHLGLVSSMLYSPDHAFFHIAAERNAPDQIVRQAIALQDEFNDDIQDSGISDLFDDAIPWALTYDSMVFKLGWNNIRGELFGTLIPPHHFGVYREDETELDAQQAFCHTYFLDWHESVIRLIRAGRARDIPRLSITNRPFVSPFPDMLNSMIISATGGSNLQGNVIGQINPLYTPTATYQPRVDVPTVEWSELWAWDDQCEDYRCFHMVKPDILISDSKTYVEALWGTKPNVLRKKMQVKKDLVRPRRSPEDGFNLQPEDDLDGNGAESGFHRSRSNLFFPRDHPFTVIRPYGKYNYFWGMAHIDNLMALQDWMTERLDQIADILEKQAYPARVGSGIMGMADEKIEAFGGADTWMLDQSPNAQVKELKPEMPPDIFHDVNEIGGMFLEASGLTELIAGRGETGVRSGRQERSQKQTGGARIKKAALKLEPALARIGDIGLRLKMRNDEELITPEQGDDEEKAVPFMAAQIASEVKIRVDGHSHSPLFADESREAAQLLKRAGAIDNEMYVRMLNPPAKQNIIHSMRMAEKRQARLMQQAQQNPALLQLLTGKHGKGQARK